MKKFDALNMPSMNEIRRRPKKWVAASLFSGCGGASTGLAMAGFDVRYACEFIGPAAEAYARNFPKTKLDTRDIRKVKPEDVLKACRVKKGQLDYLDLSPPCKLYSQAAIHSRKNKADDEVVLYSENVKQRVDDLFDEGIRLIKGIMPKVFVAENVPGLAMEKHAHQFLEFFTKFEKAGYRVEARIIDPSKFGVPQRRRRLVFVGVRKDLKKDPVFPKPTGRIVTVRDVLPYATHIHEGAAGYGDTRRPGPTIVANGYRFNETSVMSSAGYIRVKGGEERKLKISELHKLFAMPAGFKLIGHFQQRWERLGRTHLPLQVYYIASTIAEEILS